jgi:hypothetical protein
MTMRKTLLALLLIAAAAPMAAAEDQPDSAQTPDEPQWTEFQSPERGFAVSFPGAPVSTSTPVEGLNPLLQHEFQVSVGDDTVYSVVVFEYPTGKAPNPPSGDYYLKLVNAYAKGADTRVRKKGDATIADKQGFEALVQDNTGTLSHMIDIVPDGDRIYMLISAGAKNHFKSDDAARFRDSFRLLGNPEPSQSASSPTTTPAPAQ